MATTSTSGTSNATGSMIDVAGIVSGLMQVENRPLDVLTAKIAASNTKISVLGQFQSKLSAVQTALDALQTPANFAPAISSSYNSVATASASAVVASGRYSLNVTQTAEAALVNLAGYQSATDAIPQGNTYTIQVGTDQAVTYTASANATLSDLVTWVNSQPTLMGQVQASIVQASGNQYVLSLQGLQTGASHDLTVTTNQEGVSVDAHPAQDALFTLNNITFTRASNTVSDAISGMTLNLIQSGTTVLQAGNSDTTPAKTLLGNLVTSYNDLLDFYKTQTAASTDPSTRGLFNSEYSIQSVMNQLQTAFMRPLTDLQNQSLKNPLNPASTQPQHMDLLGLEFTPDGHLALNATLLDRSPQLMSVLASGIRIGYDPAAKGDLSQSIAAMFLDQGAVYQRVQSEQALQRDMSKKKADLQDRLARVQQQYTAQYAALDALLFKLNSTSTSLKGALDALSNSSKSN